MRHLALKVRMAAQTYLLPKRPHPYANPSETYILAKPPRVVQGADGGASGGPPLLPRLPPQCLPELHIDCE